MRGFFAITLPLYIADQITKLMAFQGLREPIVVVPGFFELELAFNTGAAFGIMRDNNIFFVWLSTIAGIVLCFLLALGKLEGRLMTIGGWLILAGILGNLTDRLWNHAVIDFLAFQFGSYRWPNFNIADSCICVAVGLFFIASFQTPSPPKTKEPEPEPPVE